MEVDGVATGFRYDDVVLPHLHAARRLARALVRNEHDAEDAVQEASLRALRYFRTFTGGSGRAWFLRIVRNTCSAWYNRGRDTAADPFDEERHSSPRPEGNPETLALHAADVTVVAQALRALPDRSRNLLVLRELEELSYRELAAAMDLPIGTVMSSLSRARVALRRMLDQQSRAAGARRHVRRAPDRRARTRDGAAVIAVSSPS
jgi:RNA polymerase sigma-70 factor, ECF subfamily